MRPRIPLTAAVITATLLLATGCANATVPLGSTVFGGDPLPTPAPAGFVLAQGTVLQVGDAVPMLCLGAVAESFPPQCSGPEMRGWDWSAIDLKESEAGVTWGTFAATGTWDGVAFTSTGTPIPLALYDSVQMPPDSRLDPESPGVGEDAALLRIDEDLRASAGPSLLDTFVSNGYLFARVTFDDGTVQEFVDAEFGPGLIAVVSALTPVAS